MTASDSSPASIPSGKTPPPRRFSNDDQVFFLSFLRVWIDRHGYTAQSLLKAWDEFKGNHLMDQSPKIQDLTRDLTHQLIARTHERSEGY